MFNKAENPIKIKPGEEYSCAISMHSNNTQHKFKNID